jgi:hypothetical protein
VAEDRLIVEHFSQGAGKVAEDLVTLEVLGQAAAKVAPVMLLVQNLGRSASKVASHRPAVPQQPIRHPEIGAIRGWAPH